jgi:hypothetical protein
VGFAGKIENQGDLMIIGVCGLIGAGKDTIADYLVNIHEFRRESFAGTLKDAVSAVFGWDRVMLEGRTKSSREWRERPDVWWSQRLDREITPRWVLQYWGTEVCRRGFHDDIWIASLENKLQNSQDNVVISDCRFPNEIEAIRRAGGHVIRVMRGPDPDWFNVAMAHIKQDQAMPDNLPHASEWAWAGTEFDAMIYNNGTLDDLYSQINDLVQDRLDARQDLLD